MHGKEAAYKVCRPAEVDAHRELDAEARTHVVGVDVDEALVVPQVGVRHDPIVLVVAPGGEGRRLEALRNLDLEHVDLRHCRSAHGEDNLRTTRNN